MVFRVLKFEGALKNDNKIVTTRSMEVRMHSSLMSLVFAGSKVRMRLMMLIFLSLIGRLYFPQLLTSMLLLS